MAYLQEHFPLKAHNSFGIAARARWWLEVKREMDLVEFLMDNIRVRRPLYVWGGGSNILLTGDLEAVVIKNAILGQELLQEDEYTVKVRVGAGENWHKFVQYCLANNWGGVENLSLIPGSVGAAPIQNIGAYGVELQSVCLGVEAIDLQTGLSKYFDREACQFGYRDSYFKRNGRGRYLISQVDFQLHKPPHQLHTDYGTVAEELEQLNTVPDIQSVSEAVCRIRRRKLPDPDELGNAGSFFKNPEVSQEAFEDLRAAWPGMPHYPLPDQQVKVPAAWLIQQCGWKGHRRGNHGVHTEQALVLVNYGGASGKEILLLAEEIQASVARKFGISLVPEVQVL